MKKYLFMALFGWSLFTLRAHAQWVVSDPMNFAGNIANTVKEIATAGKTVKNTLAGFKEIEKLYNDTKKYYDALKKVNNLIGDAYKVKECVLMVGEISEIYVKSYKRMLQDKNFRPSELAAIASGSQKWNGNWAAFVNALTATNTANAAVSPGLSTQKLERKIP